MQLSNEERIFTVLLQRFNKYHVPVLLKLKDKVYRGEKLDESELEFLEQVFKATQGIMPKVLGNPQYHKIFVNAIQLYTEITEKALNNAQKNLVPGKTQRQIAGQQNGYP